MTTLYLLIQIWAINLTSSSFPIHPHSMWHTLMTFMSLWDDTRMHERPRLWRRESEPRGYCVLPGRQASSLSTIHYDDVGRGHFSPPPGIDKITHISPFWFYFYFCQFKKRPLIKYGGVLVPPIDSRWTASDCFCFIKVWSFYKVWISRHRPWNDIITIAIAYEYLSPSIHAYTNIW